MENNHRKFLRFARNARTLEDSRQLYCMCCIANDITTNPFLSIHLNLFLLLKMFLLNYCNRLLTGVALTSAEIDLDS